MTHEEAGDLISEMQKFKLSEKEKCIISQVSKAVLLKRPITKYESWALGVAYRCVQYKEDARQARRI